MGRDKPTLEVDGASLFLRAHRSLAPWCDDVTVIGPTGYGELPRRDDLRAGRAGPLAGIEAAFAAARHDRVFVIAADMPFVTPDLVGFLLNRLDVRDGRAAAVPRHGVVHPLCAAYDRRRLLPPVTAALDAGVRSVREFLAGREDVEYVEEELGRFGDPNVFLMSVNTPEDLGRARAVAATRDARV